MSRGCKGKGIVLDKKESGFMACLFIRCADVAMEIGLVVYRPQVRCHVQKLVPDMTDYQWDKGYADVIDKLVTKCWQEEAYVRCS